MGKNIYVVKLGKGANKVFYSGSFHANEWITSVILMKFIEDYSYAYVNNTSIYGYNIRNLFNNCNFDINKIRNYIQFEYKKDFPYLSGNKICNYWLYVLYQYADAKYQNLQDLTIAPDTHVIQATRKLEIINDEEYSKSNVQHIVIQKWNELLKDTEFCPIDLHTPLWLWSRNGFKEIKNC